MKHGLILLAAVMLIAFAPPRLAATGTVDVAGFVRTTESFLEELNAFDELSLAVMITKDGVPILEKAYGIATRFPTWP